MRAYLNLVTGEASAEFPMRPNDYCQRVKGLSAERVELQWMEDGTPLLLPVETQIRLSVRTAPGGTLLAELTDFTAPTVAGGFYTGRLSLNTEAVVTMLGASPTQNAFPAVGELGWLIPGATDWELSDNLTFSLLRGVGGGGDPLALASPYEWLVGSLVAGSNVTIATDNVTKQITISAAGGGGGSGNFSLDRVSDDGAFIIVKDVNGDDWGKMPVFAL